MDQTEAKRRQTFTGQIEAHFRANEGAWIPAADLLEVGGAMAWRTRVSEARKVFEREGGALENRQQRVAHAVLSEYRYLSQARQGRDSTVPEPTAFADRPVTQERLW